MFEELMSILARSTFVDVWMRNSKFRFRDIENQLGDIVLMRVLSHVFSSIVIKSNIYIIYSNPRQVSFHCSQCFIYITKQFFTAKLLVDFLYPFHSNLKCSCDTPTRVLANGRGFLRHGRTPQRTITSPIHPVMSLPLCRLFCGCLF